MSWMQENIDEWRISPEMKALCWIRSLISGSGNGRRSLTGPCQEGCPGLKIETLGGPHVALPGHREVVKLCTGICPGRSLALASGRTYGKYFKLTFLVLHHPRPGTVHAIHREALGDIHRTLIRLIGERHYKKDIPIVDQTFALLKEHKGRYPGNGAGMHPQNRGCGL